MGGRVKDFGAVDIFTFILFFFVLFIVAKSLYGENEMNSYLDSFSGQNDEMREANTKSKSDLEYFESTMYKDLYAKENLNKLQDGEKVILINKGKTKKNYFEKKLDVFNQDLESVDVWQQWMIYFNFSDNVI